jgi:hypothetical protein
MPSIVLAVVEHFAVETIISIVASLLAVTVELGVRQKQ